MKKQSFLTGAVILMIANAISKILGAVFKIPLTYILKEEGMAVYNIAFEVYIMFLSFVISGLPFAISKKVAEANSKKEYLKTRQIVNISTLLLISIGAIGSVLLYFCSPFFALAMKEEKAIYAIKVISPSVFFVALGTAYKSYYQGVSNMIPTAISQVVEAIVKLVAGYGLAILFLKFGMEKTAGGAIMGVTVGEIVATAILMAMYYLQKKEKNSTQRYSSQSILKELIEIAFPLLCASVVSNAVNIADTTLIRSTLLDAGFSNEQSRFLYGAYTGYALTVFHLPVGILATMGVSILPVIAGAVAVGNKKKTQDATDVGIRISVILSLPCSVLMYFFSKESLEILFHNSYSAEMLSVVSPCVVMMCVTQMCGAILQSSGRIMLPFFISLVGSAVKLTGSRLMIINPEINIYGSAISSVIAYVPVMIMNLLAIKKCIGLKLNILTILVKPAISATVMCLFVLLSKSYLNSVLGGGFLFLAVMCFMSCIVYILMLLFTNAISLTEIRKILKG